MDKIGLTSDLDKTLENIVNLDFKLDSNFSNITTNLVKKLK